MCKMLLSINPEHVENIMNGNKLYEFRKIKCKSDVDKIVFLHQILGKLNHISFLCHIHDIIVMPIKMHRARA